MSFWCNSLTFCWRKWGITWRIYSQGKKFISGDTWMSGGLFNYPVSNEVVLLHQLMRKDNGCNCICKYGVVANLKVLPQHSPLRKITKIPVRRFGAPTSTWTSTSLPLNASQKYYCLSHLTWSKKWVIRSTFHYVCCIRFEAFTADIFTKIILGDKNWCIGDLMCHHHQGQCQWQFISRFTTIITLLYINTNFWFDQYFELCLISIEKNQKLSCWISRMSCQDYRRKRGSWQAS